MLFLICRCFVLSDFQSQLYKTIWDLKKELNGLTSKSNEKLNEKLQLKLMENQLKIGSCRCQECSTTK